MWNALEWLRGICRLQDILNSLEKYYPNLKPHELDEFRIVNTTGDTDMMDLAYLDHSTCSGITLEPLYNSHLTIMQQWAPTGATAANYVFPIKVVTVNADSFLPRLLMSRNSFTSDLAPLLSDHFSQAVYLWSFPTAELYNDIAIEKPDVVIIEMTERYLDHLKTILAANH